MIFRVSFAWARRFLHLFCLGICLGWIFLGLWDRGVSKGAAITWYRKRQFLITITLLLFFLQLLVCQPGYLFYELLMNFNLELLIPSFLSLVVNLPRNDWFGGISSSDEIDDDATNIDSIYLHASWMNFILSADLQLKMTVSQQSPPNVSPPTVSHPTRTGICRVIS